MSRWSTEIEEELALLLRDWLKHQGRTQADLRKSLQAMSTRMPSLLEVLQKEYSLGGLPKLAARLCSIEDEWSRNIPHSEEKGKPSDPFGQLDLLLQEIRHDCDG